MFIIFIYEYFMAGHSRWSNIKHKKQANDAKKSKLFSKLINDIKVALQEGSSDVKNNYKLKNAISRAIDNNVSKSVIENILFKNSNVIVDKKLYAAIGMQGTVFLFDCRVSNNNKILSELRYLFNKFSVSLTSLDNVLYLFNKFYKISLINNYNSDVIFKFFSDVFINKFEDNVIDVNFDCINDINVLFSFLNIKIETSVFFTPKILLKLDNFFFDKMFCFKNDLKKTSYVLNIFTNF